MFKSLLSKVIGDPNERELNRLRPFVEEINALEPEFEALSDEEFRGKTKEFTDRLRAGESLSTLVIEAFAAVREASKRTTGMRHFDVQLMGGMVLHEGKVAEMRTGEGKTLVATLPLYLNALEGKGCHLVTVNDYLAKRDTQWMGPIYRLLGLSMGVIQHESAFLFDPEYLTDDERYQSLRPVSRRQAYEADITYGTNHEFGFDYLRDNMVLDLSQQVQRDFHYAIVDEVDYILIDEARTPLIISGPADEPDANYRRMADLVPRLRREADYVIDEKVRLVTLTEEGIERMERWLGVDNLYSPENFALNPYVDNALRAQTVFHRDRNYIVKDGQVIIVDEFTGRLMHGRRYSEGLHQAIEAKEGVEVQRENLTMATITLQNYFRMYEKLAGMTGTAVTEAEELHKIYGLDVVVLLTNVEYQALEGRLITQKERRDGAEVVTYRNPANDELYYKRIDYPDLIYKSEEAKFRAVVQEIGELQAQGRPVLVGTVFIERSEMLSEMLRRKGIPHQVLNAKYHEREAVIITQAGRPDAVTIATNMAGRGVDIKLGGDPEGLAREDLRRQGMDLTTVSQQQWAEALAQAQAICKQGREKVLELGGLHILGTERHEARRIDNQLRGRSGRQGDPGSSRFYVSLEDELMRRFGGERVKGFMEWAGMEEDIPIEHDLITKTIGNAQTRVEGHNFDIRKHLLEYDDVVNKQREIIYQQRHQVLSEENLKPIIMDMIHEELARLVALHTAGYTEDWDLEALQASLRTIMPLPASLTPSHWRKLTPQEIEEQMLDLAERLYEEKERQLGAEDMRHVERLVMLRTVDNLWIRHLTGLDNLREGIGLRAYGQQDPLMAFKKEAHEMYAELLGAIQRAIVGDIYRVSLVREPQPRPMREMRTSVEAQRAPQPVRTAGATVGRNDPCPCGSGKKYKHCCMRKEQASAPSASEKKTSRRSKKRRKRR
ncbi:MAG: SEC-C domain-containing protein [Anaerolineales bacterium]|nr:SEC-C domain-containing protein [Anaerolineales bacterium]